MRFAERKNYETTYWNLKAASEGNVKEAAKGVYNNMYVEDQDKVTQM
jgi:hypothetical protein